MGALRISDEEESLTCTGCTLRLEEADQCRK
jgi:hypothetical protein